MTASVSIKGERGLEIIWVPSIHTLQSPSVITMNVHSPADSVGMNMNPVHSTEILLTGTADILPWVAL